MAVLIQEDGTTCTDLQDIADALQSLQIQINCWLVGDNPQLHQLLAKDSLNDDEKAQVLMALDHYFKPLQQTVGYQSRDLIVLHPEVPNLQTLLAKFDKIHTHADNEVRYIIDGEGVFGFVRPDGSQVQLLVQSEEYIHVPAGTEHWFYLTQKRRIKAIRYFTDPAGWVPHYTDRGILVRQPIAV
jgi:1,2-dihydroxy-3-keto-5-methylthiopentene dioxygenase